MAALSLPEESTSTPNNVKLWTSFFSKSPMAVVVTSGSVNVCSSFDAGELIVKIPLLTTSLWIFIMDMIYS
jgi:hypothetical protein